MGDLEGGGADNLDYTSYTYEELRAAVYAIDEDALRASANEWADLKHKVNERVGTLRVEIVKLDPAWDSPAGRHALGLLGQQRDWMDELAKVAAWNQEQLSQVQDAYYGAIRRMRALDAEALPTPDKAPNPAPAPGPDGTVPYASPSDHPKQPRAARIASDLYSAIAVAAASMSLPPEGPDWDPRSDGIPGDGPANPTYQPGAGPRPPGGGAGRPSGGAPPVSKSGRSVPGRVVGNPGPRTGPVPPSAPGRVPGTDRGSGPATSAPGGEGGRSRAPVASGGRGGVPGVGRPGAAGELPGSGGPARGTEALGRTIGGGSRPTPGVPAGPPGTGQPPPGVPSHPMAPGRGDNRPGRKKPGYERAEPDTFVDGRFANVIGGTVRGPEQERRFDPAPGMLGTQRQPAVEDPDAVWQVPETPAATADFPEELRDFRRKDGVEFQVRRRNSGA